MTRSSTMHRRRSPRLKGYDYATAGAYFVTICTQDRACLFGDVVTGAVCLNEAGQMVAALWDNIPTRFSGVEIDRFVVMPNHLHGIVVLPDVDATAKDGATTGVATGATTRVAPTDHPTVGAPLVGAPLRAARLGDIVGAFKSIATVGYISGVKANGWPEFHRKLWQRNYYEHVIRDEAALERIRRYVEDNPARWEFDDENPRKTRP